MVVLSWNLPNIEHLHKIQSQAYPMPISNNLEFSFVPGLLFFVFCVFAFAF